MGRDGSSLLPAVSFLLRGHWAPQGSWSPPSPAPVQRLLLSHWPEQGTWRGRHRGWGKSPRPLREELQSHGKGVRTLGGEGGCQTWMCAGRVTLAPALGEEEGVGRPSLSSLHPTESGAAGKGAAEVVWGESEPWLQAVRPGAARPRTCQITASGAERGAGDARSPSWSASAQNVPRGRLVVSGIQRLH